jgi:hypothetical protein
MQFVLEPVPRRSRLTFQVDLFHVHGREPADLEEVSERGRDIRCSSKTRAVTDLFRTIHDVRHDINNLWDQLCEPLRDTPEAKFLYGFGCVTTMDIVELIYRPPGPEGPSKDYEFSRSTMKTRRARTVRPTSDAARIAVAACPNADQDRCPHLRRAQGPPPRGPYRPGGDAETRKGRASIAAGVMLAGSGTRVAATERIFLTGSGNKSRPDPINPWSEVECAGRSAAPVSA